MLEMPVLETARLLIRPFGLQDLQAAHQLLDIELDASVLGSEKMTSLDERAEWLQWSSRNPRQLALLNQPPYGDRAIILKSNGELIGSCGLVPALNRFEQIPYFASSTSDPGIGYNTPEMALFYAISPRYWRQGYALECAQELVRYCFTELKIKRILAETDYTNAGSIAVMKRLGMKIEINPYPEPAQLQVVGVLENPGTGQ